eukprot:2768-Heterococcus_DN1.PRE.5
MESLRTILWCTITQWALRGRPTQSDIAALAAQARHLKVSDPVLTGVFDSITARAHAFQDVVTALFKPDTQAVASITVQRNLLAHANNVNILLRLLTQRQQGSRKPIDIKKLKALLDRMHTEMPVETKAEIQAKSAVEDKGQRYCVCLGPNDGRWMIGCDECEDWFHG